MSRSHSQYLRDPKIEFPTSKSLVDRAFFLQGIYRRRNPYSDRDRVAPSRWGLPILYRRLYPYPNGAGAIPPVLFRPICAQDVVGGRYILAGRTLQDGTQQKNGLET